jgi:FtsH-binding integral membrane protein
MNNFSSSISKTINNALYKTFAWMGAGLTVTGIVAYILSMTSFMSYLFDGTLYGWLFKFVIFGAQMALIFTIINMNNIIKYSYATLATLFMLFSATSGMTLSYIFVIYELQSIVGIFFIAAGMFLGCAMYGFLTKTDLSPMHTFVMMSLIGILIFSLINLFVGSLFFSKAMSVLSIGIFSLITAMDIQNLKNIYAGYAYDTELQRKLSILGALIMYQNFINIFIHLLNLLGKKKK